MCHSIVLGPAYGCYKNSPVYHMTVRHKCNYSSRWSLKALSLVDDTTAG